MPEVLPIVKFGHPILTKKARDVEDVADPVIQRLIDDMIKTFQDANGLGIAGPQVGHGLRVFTISSRRTELYPNACNRDPIAMINPVILDRSRKKVTNWESCLSIPGIYGRVPRHSSIKVTYTNRMGQRVIERLTGLLAIAFQHELDHLDGILFLDRIEPNETYTKEEFQKKIAQEPIKIRA